jgi:hypothetical protein
VSHTGSSFFAAVGQHGHSAGGHHGIGPAIDVHSILSLVPKGKPQAKKGSIWRGFYVEIGGRQCPMHFQKFKVKGDKVKGKGRDEVGEFKIKGKVHNGGGVTFKKEYKGRGHKVEYDGRLEDNGRKIHGQWSMSHGSADFEITVSN